MLWSTAKSSFCGTVDVSCAVVVFLPAAPISV